MSVVLSVRGVGKSFGQLTALQDVSFQARAGETLAVVGPNGAGKTTLLSIIAGTQRASAGSVEGPAQRRGTLEQIGWAPQQPALYSRLTVAENLRLFARLARVADPNRGVALMLEQTGLLERAEERLGRLSAGNQQRVNVAIALLADPPVLALDEPSSALDPGQRARLWQFIGGLAERGRSVLFSTHNVVEAERYADRVIVLDRGTLMFDGTPVALMRSTGAEDGDFEGALVRFLADRAGP